MEYGVWGMGCWMMMMLPVESWIEGGSAHVSQLHFDLSTRCSCRCCCCCWRFAFCSWLAWRFRRCVPNTGSHKANIKPEPLGRHWATLESPLNHLARAPEVAKCRRRIRRQPAWMNETRCGATATWRWHQWNRMAGIGMCASQDQMHFRWPIPRAGN